MTGFAPRPIVVPYALHDYQELAVADAVAQSRNVLYASPTGTGKSLIGLGILARDPDALLVTPRLEIVAGMLQKCGEDTSEWSDTRLAREALAYRITTPIRLRNLLAKGELPFRPRRLVVDECHHEESETFRLLDAYLPGAMKTGLTATPFRGTPKSTEAFLSRWDEVVRVLTLPQAAARGAIEVPEVELWPLVDDELIAVQNGEFKTKDTTRAVGSRLAEVVDSCRGMIRALSYQVEPYTGWDRPTLFAVPSTDCVHDLVDRLNGAGLPAYGVTQDTTRADRNRAFTACVSRTHAVVQIDVVSEGVDLPVRRLIDLRPTMSPVRWMQQLGRITRPRKRATCSVCGGNGSIDSSHYFQPILCERCDGSGFTIDPPSVYVCCNRNLERHAYLMEGLVPAGRIADAQKMFPKPSARSGSRAIGLEAIGRFKAADLPFADGTIGQMYCLSSLDGFARTDYAVILHPCVPDPLYASRQSTGDATGAVAWGRWKRTDGIPDVTGFQSAAASDLSPKQADWWKRSAGHFGLDGAAKPNRRSFAALPVLKDLGVRIRSGGF